MSLERRGISLIFEIEIVIKTCYFQNVCKMKMSQQTLMTLVTWHHFTQGDQKALQGSAPLFYVHYAHRETQSRVVSVLQPASCQAEAEWTASPEGQRTLPMTTRLRSCFPPCRFSSSALTSICCLSLLDFFTGVCVELCSSDARTVWDGRAGLEMVSRTSAGAMLASSLGCPL